jgi:hypothetical protein
MRPSTCSGRRSLKARLRIDGSAIAAYDAAHGSKRASDDAAGKLVTVPLLGRRSIGVCSYRSIAVLGCDLSYLQFHKGANGFHELRIYLVRDDHYVCEHLFLIEFALMEM